MFVSLLSKFSIELGLQSLIHQSMFSVDTTFSCHSNSLSNIYFQSNIALLTTTLLAMVQFRIHHKTYILKYKLLNTPHETTNYTTRYTTHFHIYASMDYTTLHYTTLLATIKEDRR